MYFKRFISNRKIARASLACLTSVLASLATLHPVHANPADYPAKPIRLVVPYPPGGTADILAREVAQRLAPELGQSVVIENRAGAGTAIGARHVAAAPADGYTIFIGTSTSHAINPALQSAIGYDPLKDFTPLAALGEVPYVLVMPASKGVQTLDDLLLKARSAGKPLSYSSAGLGSSNHLGGVLLSQLAGVEFIHVPYKGSAPALNDLLAGQVDFMFDLVTTSQSHVREGRLRALATTAKKRAEVLPQVPTSAEAGQPKLQVTAWFGLFAPPNLPEPVGKTLGAALDRVLASAEAKDKLRGLGLSLLNQRGAEFGRFVAQDLAHWRKVVRDSSIKLEN